MEDKVMELEKVGEVYITPVKTVVGKPPLCDSFPDNETIEFVAIDESNGIDWNDLAFRPVWVDGFIAGAKWARSVKK